MQEVCGVGDGSMASGAERDQAAADLGLSQGLRPPRPDGRRTARRPLARETGGGGHALPRRRSRRRSRSPASTSSAATWRNATCCRVSARGWRTSPLDEQRHIGFGVKLLADLIRGGPVRVGDAVVGDAARGDALDGRVVRPPGWDERYTTAFGSTLDDVDEEGARRWSKAARDRAARRRPPALPAADGPAAARARRARAEAPARRAASAPKRRPRLARSRGGRDPVRHDPGARPTGTRRSPAPRSSGTSRTRIRGICAATTARPPSPRAARRPPTSP